MVVISTTNFSALSVIKTNIINKKNGVERPGTQSNFNPNPGINQECTTSQEFVTTVIFTWAGKTNVLFVLNNLLA